MVKGSISKATTLVVACLLLGLLTGCAAQKAYRRAEKESRRDNWDQAVLDYSKAKSLDPGNPRYGVALERAKLKSSAQHFQKGKRYMAANQLRLAVAEFQQTLLLHPGNQHARNEMTKALRELELLASGPSDLERMKERARLESMGPPRLDPTSNIPIILNFQDVEVGKIFDAIGKASQINFIFDEKTDLDQKKTIDLGNVTLEKAMDILMLQTKNFYKVIDEHTILIAPDTRPKRQEYEDQVIRTFYLSNGDTKQVVTLLRSLLQSRQIAENPDLNSVTIKDTPDKVAIAERIITSNDKSKGEVLIDVELLEINRTLTQNLGIDLSSKTMSLQFQDGAASLPLNNLNVLKQKGNWSVGVIPSVIINFLKSDTDSKSIAKPQLRVTEGEKAEILIGDRVPIPTTSFNTSQTVGGNIVPITSFTYQNVGITVQMEARVHHNKEVTLTVQVEVSQVTGSVETGSGQAQPIIGTRQIQSVLRLRDGETSVLAGLIKQEDTNTLSGVPGIMDTPGLGRMFSNKNTQRASTDIIMTLTPQIIRMPDITEEDLATLWVGTEENMRLRGPTRGVFGITAFGSGDVPGAATDTTADAVAGAAERRTGGGGVSTITPSDEVRQDREARERDASTSSGGDSSDRGSNRPEIVPLAEGDVTRDEGEPPLDDTPEQPTGPAVVRLVPSSGQVRVGDPVIIQVFIDNGNDVGSVPFHLRYDRQMMQFVPPAGEGGFLNGDGTNTVFLATEAAGGGEIVVGHSRMGGSQGAAGSGVLGTFQFQAINPGDCTFTFSGATVKNPQARNRPASFVPATVQVVE
ncbi:MAG: hypothetical protein IFK94_00710 [Acidobacteria bacterium]|uniref:Secretin/TonB short N-terminal domain-containing protein n=1 Tax=Candidatus Polarisedimenticola svalbardensis TaxID=2886004 RepID=A0A8J6XQ93_9BACT|nr:hypothetical protein [Candidatus Polarisedimenticola svalbardensis]